MAEKEATVFVVDVGKSMGKPHQGRDESDLEWSLRYVWDKITSIISTGRKTTTVGVLGLGTDETDNSLGDEEAYQHISVLQPISQILMPDLRRLRRALVPSTTNERDAISAVILAIQMITSYCKHNKWTKRIVLVTNASGAVDPDNIEDIARKLKKEQIQLVVLGVDFDDAGFGFRQKDKPAVKAKSEALLHNLVNQSDGVIGTMQEAIEELVIPRIKTIKPIPSYKGPLRLGNPDLETALVMEVERYPKTMIKRPPTASSFVLRQADETAEALETVRNMYSYQIKDETAAGGKRDVPREALAKGYEYGRTAVHINESDENVVKLDTEAGYDILGFVPADKVERYLMLDPANLIVVQKADDKSILALSSLIHALFELGSCAVGRVVKKDMAEPLVTLLSAHIEEDFECLIENQLPFAEDVRSYRFPPLAKVLTVSGKSLSRHRNLPSDELLQSMSDFVDSMGLSTNGEDEYMSIEDTFSPILHRIEDAIRYRAVHPDSELPPVAPMLTKFSGPPESVRTESETALRRLITAADVKKVPPKAKGRKRYREVEKPLSGLDVEGLFRKEKRTKLSPDNAIPEFKQILASSDSLETVQDAVTQMTAILEDQIRHSLGDGSYDRVAEGLGVMRQELLELEEPALYNDALRRLKSKIFAEELGGNRREMWWYIRKGRLGLIDKRSTPVSDVSPEEADSFMTATAR